MDNDAVSPQCLGGCCLGVTFVGFLIALSGMAVVEPTEYAVTFNRFRSRVEDKEKEGGRYWIGPQSFFVKFPAVAQSLEWSDRAGRTSRPLTARTNGAATITVSFAFQYILKAEKIVELFRTYRGDQFSITEGHKSFFIREAQSEIIRVVSNTETFQYYQNRSLIGQQFEDGLRERLQDWTVVTNAQLIRVQLQDSVEQNIIEQQLQRQLQLRRQREQEVVRYRAETDNILASYARDVVITEQEARANANLLTKTAQAIATETRINTERTALQIVEESVKLSSTGKVKYQKAIAYQDLPNAQFLYGVQQAAAIVRSSSPSMAERGATEGVCTHMDGDSCTGSLQSQYTTELSPELVAAAQSTLSSLR